MVKVSIIIPCYNQGLYIEECLESVLNQSYKDIEVIVINDGSSDLDTLKILQKMKKKYPEFIFHDIENSGVSQARNIGIEMSKGSYILPLDSDDKITPRYVERCMETFNTKNVDVVYCVGEFFGDKTGIWYLPSYSKEEIIKNNIVFCSAMFSKKSFYECGGYNTNMLEGLEDWDFWLSMTEKDKIFYRLNERHFFYRIKKDSRNKNMLDIHKRKRTLQQLQNNHPKLYENYNIPEVNTSFLKKIFPRIKYEWNKYWLYNRLQK